MGKLVDLARSALAVQLLVAGAVLAGPGAAAAEGGPGVGSRLTPLELTDIGGRRHQLAWGPSAPAAAVLLFFFEARCTECVREMIFVEGMLRSGRDFGLAAFAVESSGLAAAGVEAALARFRGIYGGPSFPVVADPGRELAARLGVRVLPASFLVQRHGVVLARADRFGDREAVELSWKTERLLGVGEGFFSPALQEIEVDAGAERRLRSAARLAAAGGGGGRGAAAGPLAEGEVVPPFAFTDFRGERHRWEARPGRGGLTVVFFWGAICEPCIREMAFLEGVFRGTRDLGLTVIAVEGSGLDAARVAVVVERYRRFRPAPSYHVVPDPDHRIGRLFGATGALPQTFLVDGSGRVAHVTDEFVEGHEAALGREIETALGLAPGELARRAGPAPPAAAGGAEAPSVVADIGRGEQYRVNRVEGDSHYAEWRFDRALPYYLKCLEIAPRDADVRARVARIYQRQGLLDVALGHWLELLRVRPGDPEALSRVEALRGQGVVPAGAI